MKKLLILIVCSFSLLVTACSNLIPSYKIDVQQGNILEEQDINQIELGMNKRKIRYILGSPTIHDPFHANRWDYIYTYKPGYGEMRKKNITLYFEGDKLVKTEGSLTPDPQQRQDVAQYKKQEIITIDQKPKEDPSWYTRIWNSFFGEEVDYDLYD